MTFRSWADRTSVVVLGWALLAGIGRGAYAQDANEGARNFLNMSFSADGMVPSGMALFEGQDRQVSSARAAVGANAKGDGSYGVSVSLPPAILMPELSLSYGVQGGRHSVLGRGWSLQRGMTVAKLSPSVRAGAYAYVAEDLRSISGGGLSGMLVEESTGWEYMSAGAALVEATFSGGEWTIRSQGTTTVLERHDNANGDAQEWHVRSVTDAFDNQVVYNWSGPYLESIHYGHQGASYAESAPIISVDFYYEALAPVKVSRQARGDRMHVIDQRIWRIATTVCPEDTSLSCTEDAPYELSYTDVDGEDMLTLVERVEPTDYATVPDRLVVADMSYTGQVNDEVIVPIAPVVGVPGTLGVSNTGGAGRSSISRVYSSFQDKSGDGIPDLLTGYRGMGLGLINGDPWEVSSWRWQSSATNSTRDMTAEAFADLPVEDNQELTTTVECSPNETVSYTTQLMYDINGDGILDILASAQLAPPPYFGDATADLELDDWCADYLDAAGTVTTTAIGTIPGLDAEPVVFESEFSRPTRWDVWYGTPSGFQAARSFDQVPFNFPRISNSYRLTNELDIDQCTYLSDSCGLAYYANHGADVDVRDMNGDGWADIVHVRQTTFQTVLDVYLKDPVKGGGWAIQPETWNAPVDMYGLGFSVAKESIEDFTYDVAHLEGGGLRSLATRLGNQVSVASFTDINADGFIDYVEVPHALNRGVATANMEADGAPQGFQVVGGTEPFELLGGPWDVWLGNGHGFQGRIDWNAPSGVPLSYSDEGVINRVVLSINYGGNGMSLPNLSAPNLQSKFLDRLDPGVAGFDEAFGSLGCQQAYTDRLSDGYDDYAESPHDQQALNDLAQTFSDGLGSYNDCQAGVSDTQPSSGDGLRAPMTGPGDWASAIVAAMDGYGEGTTVQRSTRIGEPQRLLVSLLDMDGDSVPDLVDAEAGVWWRNAGSGFSGAARAIPSWFGGDLGRASVSQTSGVDVDALLYAADNPNLGNGVYQDYDPEAVKSNSSTREQTSLVLDVNRDGLPDLVTSVAVSALYDQTESGVLPYQPVGVQFNTGVVSGRLESIRQSTGAETTLTWMPSNWAVPSGSATEPHRMSTSKPLLVATDVIDPVTGHKGRTEYEYQNGICFGGVCQGFETVIKRDFRWDPELSSGDPMTRMSAVITEYALSRDWSLPLHSTTMLPVGNPWGQPAAWSAKYVYEYDYGWLAGFRPYVGGDISIQRPNGRTFTESGTRKSEVTLLRNAEGFVEEVTFTNPDDPSETTTTQTTWAYSPDMTVAVPTEQLTMAVDWNGGLSAASSTQRVIEHGYFTYDGQGANPSAPIESGLLVKQTVMAGLPNGDLYGESLEWTFEYTDRGAKSRTVGPNGEVSHIVDFTFQGALPALSQNVLGHQDIARYDGLGRAIGKTDANGIVTEYELDGFGRKTATYRTAVDGPRLQTQAMEYHVDQVPNWVDATGFRYPDAKDLSGVVPFHAYHVMDGFGGTVQTWQPDEFGSGFVVVDEITDIAGSPVRTSYPRRLANFSPDFATTRSSVFGAWSEFDAMGNAMVSFEDYRLQLGRSEISFPSPGVVRTVDQDDFWHESHTDVRGNVTQVYEGYEGAMTLTGDYLFDGLGRVARFQDAELNQHEYAYDGVGRLRQVWRSTGYASATSPLVTTDQCPLTNPIGSSSTTGTDVCPLLGSSVPLTGAGNRVPYMAYAYDGARPSAMHQGTVADPVVATWQYDTIGRLTQQTVRNRLRGTPDQYSWQYDQGGWIGTVSSVTDPAGYISYTYGPSAFGRQGMPTRVARTWNWTMHQAVFDYKYDHLARATLTRWPSGLEVTSTYTDAGWHVGDHLTQGTSVDAQIDYTYDQWGLPNGFVGQNGSNPAHTSTDVRIAPTRLTSRSFLTESLQGTATVRSIDWDFSAGGMLSTKTISGLEDPITYTYDDMRRLVGVHHGVTELESFAYDNAGNPTQVRRLFEPEWTYTDASFSEIDSRVGYIGGQKFEDLYTYDPMSRMTEWQEYDTTAGTLLSDRTLTYDGLGRMIQHAELVSMEGREYYYNADNEATLEDRFTVVTAGNFNYQERIHRFQGMRYDSISGEEIDSVLPFLRIVDGAVKWLLVDHDSHALSVFTDSGVEESFEVVGAYGANFDWQAPPSPLHHGPSWKLDGVHGAEADHAMGIVQRGTRHAMLDDGRWLQPEPMLSLSTGVATPSMLGGVYAGGNPIVSRDATGLYPSWSQVAAAAGRGFEDGVVDTLTGPFVQSAARWTEFSHMAGEVGAPKAYLTMVSKYAMQDAAIGVATGPLMAYGAATQVKDAGTAVVATANGVIMDDDAAILAGVEKASHAAGAMATEAALAKGLGGLKGGGGCFVEGTEVLTPSGDTPIEEICEQDLVIARALADNDAIGVTAAFTDEGDEAWVEVDSAPVKKSAAWAPRGVCDRVKRWARTAAVPMAMLAACDVAVMPDADEAVQVYDARTGDWFDGVGADLEDGVTFIDDGRVLRVTEDGVEIRGAAAILDLAEADATWVAAAAHRLPSGDDWVLMLGASDDAGHWLLSEVEAGERFAFQGRVFDAADVDANGDLEVRATGLVLSRVVETFVRQSDTLIDAEIQYDDGTVEVITGTPEHPFFVPALDEYVPLGDLVEGTVLHVDSGAGAVLVGRTWRQGDFTVYNFHVENQNNYFVRAPDGESPAVLVHNTCPGSVRFTQSDITDTFKDGRSVKQLTDGLVDGSIDPASVPAIRVFRQDGKLYSLDNRRLHAFQEAAKKKPGLQIPTREVDATMYKKAIDKKMNTKNDGESVDVRSTSE